MAGCSTVPERGIQPTGFDASHPPTLYLSLFVLFPITLHFNIISERRTTEKKNFTGVEPFWREKELELKLMQLMPACHSTLVPFLAVFTVLPHYKVTMSGLQK